MERGDRLPNPGIVGSLTDGGWETGVKCPRDVIAKRDDFVYPIHTFLRAEMGRQRYSLGGWL